MKIVSNGSLHTSLHVEIFTVNLQHFSLRLVSDPHGVQYNHGMMETKLDF